MIRFLLLILLSFVIDGNQPRHTVEFYAAFDPIPYGTVWDVQVSHDDSTLVVVYSDPMMIQVINLTDLSIRAQTDFNTERNFMGDLAMVLEVSHDGKFVFWSSIEDSVFNDYLWDTSNGQLEVNPFNSTDSDVSLDLIFSRTDNQATLSFSDELGGTERVEGWSIEPLERLWVQNGIGGFLRDISPDDRYVVVDGRNTWIVDWENRGKVITIAQLDENNTFPDHFVRFGGGFFNDSSRFTYIYISRPSEMVFLTNLQSVTLSPTLSRAEPVQLPIITKIGFAVRHYDQSGRYVGGIFQNLEPDKGPIESRYVLLDLQEMQIERDLSNYGIIHTGIGAYLELDDEPYTLIDFINNEETTVEYDCTSCETMFSAQGKFLIGWEEDHIEIWQITTN